MSDDIYTGTPYSFRRLLVETPYTDQAIADACGVNHSTVYRWRTGQAKPAWGHIETAVEFIRDRQREQMERVRECEKLVETVRSQYDGSVDTATNGGAP